MARVSDLPFTGFQEESGVLIGYIDEGSFDETLLKNILDINFVSYSKSIIEEKNWNEIWESDFEPVKIYTEHQSSPFAMVRASFHKPDTEAKYDLLITPKMSFGTGHHATTFQMMEQMADLDFEGKKIVDFGTGTGLLAILAEKMGAESVLAIDNDDWSIENARENIQANTCTKIQLVKDDKCYCPDYKADILLANINLNVILANMPGIVDAVSENATILFSGILKQDLESISGAILAAGLTIFNTGEMNGWLILNCRKLN